MSLYAARLAEMLCTKLCHDITGPIGAVNNGVEFLREEGGDMQEEAVALIASSVTQAISRMMYYRHAYGRINDPGEANLPELQDMARAYFSDGKITLDWPDNAGNTPALTRAHGKLLLNMLIIAAHTLARGGSLSVKISENAPIGIEITAKGVRAKVESEVREAIAGHVAENALSPRNVQPCYTALLASELDVTLHIEEGDETIRLIAKTRGGA